MLTKWAFVYYSTEESGRCFIIRPKQRPQARRRSISQRDQHEEETKVSPCTVCHRCYPRVMADISG